MNPKSLLLSPAFRKLLKLGGLPRRRLIRPISPRDGVDTRNAPGWRAFSGNRKPAFVLQLSITLIILFLTFAMSSGSAEAKSPIVEHYENSQAKVMAGNISGAVDDLRTAAGLARTTSQKSDMLVHLGDVLTSAHRFEQAAEVYREIVELKDSSYVSVGLYFLAKISLQIGDEKKAAEYSRELLSNYPQAPMVELAKFTAKSSPGSVEARLVEIFSKVSEGQVSEPADNNIINERIVTEAPPVVHEMPQPANVCSSPIDLQVKTQTTVPYSRSKRLSAEVDGWVTKPGGNIYARGLDLNIGSDVDFSARVQPFLNLQYFLSTKDRLGVTFQSSDHSGSLHRSVVLDGLAYSPGASVKLSADAWDVGGYRNIGLTDDDEWGILYGVAWSRAETTLSQPLTGGRRVGTVEDRLVSPYVGFEMKSKITDSLWAEGFAKFLHQNDADKQVSLTDAALQLLFGGRQYDDENGSGLYGILGLRYFRAGGEDNGKSGEIRFFGPIFGILAEF